MGPSLRDIPESQPIGVFKVHLGLRSAVDIVLPIVVRGLIQEDIQELDDLLRQSRDLEKQEVKNLSRSTRCQQNCPVLVHKCIMQI